MTQAPDPVPGAVPPGAPSPGAPSPGAVPPGAPSPGAPLPGAVSPGAPSPGAEPRPPWSAAPAPRAGEPAGTREPTSPNAVHPSFDARPAAGFAPAGFAPAGFAPAGLAPAGPHADGAFGPSADPGHANGLLPDSRPPTANDAVTGYWGPGDHRSANPGYPGYPANGPVPFYSAAPIYGAPGDRVASGYRPPPGYFPGPGFGTPGTWQRPPRPNGATTAGVLGIVYGSLILFAALVISFIPLVLAEGWGRRTTDTQSLTLELLVVSIFTAVCGVVMVVGGILIFRRDRSALMFGAVTALLLSTYSLVRTGFDPSFLPVPLIFSIIPVIILVKCAGSSVVSWIRWRPW